MSGKNRIGFGAMSVLKPFFHAVQFAEIVQMLNTLMYYLDDGFKRRDIIFQAVESGWNTRGICLLTCYLLSSQNYLPPNRSTRYAMGCNGLEELPGFTYAVGERN